MESRNILLAVLIVVIALGVFYMLDPTFAGLLGRKYEGFEGDVIPTNAPPSVNGFQPEMFTNAGKTDAAMIGGNPNAVEEFNASPSMPAVMEQFENPSPMPFAAAEKPANCYPKNQLAPQELLPNDPNSKWAQVNPMGAGDIAGKNFLNAGALIGVNTVGQSLRNASWDLRSEPPNPQQQVSPWMQSTIEPDTNRRVMEIA
jgi:hypothetical protein